MSEKKIIGLVGFIGSGKGTTGDILRLEHGYKAISYAEALKDCLSIIFGWPRDMIEGDTAESRKWRDEVDPWWSKELGISDFTCRKALQMVGTNALRNHVSDKLWVSVLHRKILQGNYDKWVITDCRFPNEMKLIRDLGGQVWRVKRGDEPEWFQTAVERNAFVKLMGGFDVKEVDMMKTKYSHVHESEWAWVGEDVDCIIDNDSTFERLQEKIKCQVSKTY
jgi:hypothetical protein